MERADQDSPFFEPIESYSAPDAWTSTPADALGPVQYFSDPYVAPANVSNPDQYFSDPYVTPSGGVGGLTTGLQLQPGQRYTPGRGVFGNYLGGSLSTYPGRGSYGGSSLISYIGPSVSARPAFNYNFRRRRLRDYLFNR